MVLSRFRRSLPGFREVLQRLYPIYLGLYLTITSRFPWGTNVYDRGWEVLVVLDAARVDVLRDLREEFEFLTGLNSIWSVGSASEEWIANTFTERYSGEVSQTALVTSNANVTKVIRERSMPPNYIDAKLYAPGWSVVEIDDFGYVDEVWRYGRSELHGAVPPRVMTDRAIAVGRERRPDRLIVHYQQPHAPYIHKLEAGQEPERFEVDDTFDRLQRGEVDLEAFKQSYIADLRLVLKEVQLLRENIDADRFVITADHGEAFGEWGGYEHPVGFPHPSVKRVPWIETTATDSGEYVPTVEPEEPRDTNVDAVLEALGYIER